VLASSLPPHVDPFAVGFLVVAGIAALLASGILPVLVGLPAREWLRWRGFRSHPGAALDPAPLRPDLDAPAARFAEATRILLDELAHAQLRMGGWNDAGRPGLLARCLGYRDDDDYRPTIELLREVSDWLHHASEFAEGDGLEAPEVQHTCGRIRGLVQADGELRSRVDGILAVLRELDARFSVRDSSPYRDRCPHRSTIAGSCTTDDEQDDASSRARVLASYEDVFRRVSARYADDESAREDLRQDIRLAVWLALPKHRGDASEATYVRRIAHYCGARFGRQQFKADCIDEPVDESPDLVERLDDAERRAALRAALSTLPSGQREAIELLLSGSSYREVAGRLGISESNASVRITRARKRLREQLMPIFA